MIYIGADKFGFRAIKFVENYLKWKKIEYINLGVTNDKSDIALEKLIPKATTEVLKSDNNKAILSCGTGIGVEVGANKFSRIRACLATDKTIAQWSVIYDKCNVLCLSGWKASKKLVDSILDAWFNAEYDGDKNRLKMMDEFDKWH